MGDKIATHTAFLVSWGARPAMCPDRERRRQNWRPGWETRPGTTPVGGLTKEISALIQEFPGNSSKDIGQVCMPQPPPWLGSAAAMSAMPPKPPSSIPSLAGVEIPGSRSPWCGCLTGREQC